VRIALDFDGTIADAAGAKVRYARERWAADLTVAASMRPGAVPILGDERYERMIADVYGSHLSLEMDPMPGAISALQRLAALHELHVVTARWEQERQFAERWLADRGIPVASLTVTGRGSKVGACALVEADLLFEDSPGELAQFAESGRPLRLALLETPYNAGHDRAPHWHVVPSWAAFEELVAALA
jgi:uncharacterized HAD superfamily protein